MRNLTSGKSFVTKNLYVYNMYMLLIQRHKLDNLVGIALRFSHIVYRQS